MRRLLVLVLAINWMVAVPAAQAQEDLVEALLWQACPYLLGTAAEVALKRLRIPKDEVEPAVELACGVAEAYRDIASNPPPRPAPSDDRSVDEIFCEGSFFAYCDGVAGSAGVSPELRCWLDGLALDECVARQIEQTY